MKIIADTHTHTLANDHAYSTITENATYASKIGLKFLCNTEHTPNMMGAPSIIHFLNLRILPRYIEDVMIIRGAEINIIDYNGGLDLPENIIKDLEWRIASFHNICIEDPKSEKEITKAWRKIAENPNIDVIGHCGNGSFKCDYNEMIKGFAENNKIVEINSHSFNVRPGSDLNCKIIAELCAKHNVEIVISSDAHYFKDIGNFKNSLEILKEIDFPEHLILNANEERFLNRLNLINGGKLNGEKI